MSVLHRLASVSGHRNDIPNQELAREIAAANDRAAVQELRDNLGNKSKAIQSDCIKTLYETARLNPSLVAPYVKDFIHLLESRNNRLQWGAMSALSAIASESSAALYEALPALSSTAEKGSVITRDHYVFILASLMQQRYADEVFPLAKEQLLTCPVNQLPAYAEALAPVIPEKYRPAFGEALRSRLNGMEQESKRKRVEKVLRKVKQ